MSDLIYNDRNFVSFELSLVKVVIYLLIFISDVNVVRLFINESRYYSKTFNIISRISNVFIDLLISRK